MDAITLLNEQIDVLKVLEYYEFEGVNSTSDTIRSACKLHGGKNSSGFAINPDNGLWYCHTDACGGGDVYTLVQRLESCSFPDAVQKVAEIYNIDIHDMEVRERANSYTKEITKWTEIMKRWTKEREINEYNLDSEIRAVTKFRNFHEDTLQHFKLGYVDEVELQKASGDYYKLKRRLVVPITEDGVQVGVSLRRTRANDYPKWSHQPRSIRTSEMLYNYEATHGMSSIVIVEGTFDVWAYHEIGVVAVATYGANISEGQYKLLIKTGADLILSFDGDEAGKKATQNAIKMFQYKANIENVVFDEGSDPASIPREELKQLYESRDKIC